MARTRIVRVALLMCGTAALAACEKGSNFKLFKRGEAVGAVSSDANTSPSSVKLIERDVEAPEVFQASDQGLWDGRPSLGGVWVAHPEAVEPERVIIRNDDNGKFVIGALFKRERENPGPRFQVSSDAAAALGMLAGAPDQLNVTALLRQEVPIAEETEPTGVETLPTVEEIESASLDDPIAAAGAVLTDVEPTAATVAPRPAPDPVPEVDAAPLPTPASLAPAPTPTNRPLPARTSINKPFVQIGLFSVEQNAINAGVSLRNAGVIPQVLAETSRGKEYFRVVVGPAPNAADRLALLKKVKDLGYTDAYFVRK